MLPRNELQKYCILTGFNLGQVEIDYLQHLFLMLFSKKSSTNIIFKGGTALQKIYGLHRFSIDFDFTQKGTEELKETMKIISKEMSDFPADGCPYNSIMRPLGSPPPNLASRTGTPVEIRCIAKFGISVTNPRMFSPAFLFISAMILFKDGFLLSPI